MQFFNKRFPLFPALFQPSVFSISLSPFPYVAHFSFNPCSTFSFSRSRSPYFSPLPRTSLTPLPSPLLPQQPPPPLPLLVSSVLSTRAPSPNPITSALESSPCLSTSPSLLLFQLPSPSFSSSPPPPACLPARRLHVSPCGEPSRLRPPCTGCSLCERSVVWLFSLFFPPQRSSNHDWRSQSLSFTLE